MTIKEMNERKRELGYTNETLAALSHVPASTIQKVLSGRTTSPRQSTIEALERVLTAASGPKDDADRMAAENAELFRSHTPVPVNYRNPASGDAAVLGSSFYNFGRSAPSVVAEAQAVYRSKRPGEFTVDDYLRLPDECRVELIDGRFYDMAGPVPVHQIVVSRFFNIVRNYLDSLKKPCIPLCSPLDVQLDMDNRTMVQPDFLIVCRKDIIKRARIVGAPDFVLEVLSPSTRRKDMLLKAYKYQNAGVKEYWLIDPDRKQVLVYDFTKGTLPALYGFDAKIPVSLYEGDLIIDMQLIENDLRFVEEQQE